MSLEGIFFATLSIAAVVVSLFLIITLIYFAKLMREIGLINKKVLEAAEGGVEMLEETKEYIGKIGKSVVDYFVVKILKNVKGKK